MGPVRLGELCAGASLFTDLGTGQPVEHGLRTCVISMRLAEVLNLDGETQRETFFVSLLRFLGCTADSYQVADLFDGDELGFFSGMAPMTMGSPVEELSGSVRVGSRLAGVTGGLRAVLGAVADRGVKDRLLDAHCEVASRLAHDMGLASNVSAALDKAYARWDGRGVPRGVSGKAVPISIRLSVVARDLELWGREYGSASAAETLRSRREQAYDPTVVDAALDVGIDALRRCDDDLWELVCDLEPAPRAELDDPASIRRALQALGDFADLKAPEFTGHSRRVERIVAQAAEVAGLTGTEFETLACAGCVHDVGVVAVPVRVWQTLRPGPGDTEQRRLHPMWTTRLLGRVADLSGVADVAGRHHERADGSGYPAGLSGEMGRSAGLLACAELYDEALSRTRDADQVAKEMRRLEGEGSLSKKDVSAVLAAVGAASPLVDVERPGRLTEREVDVLRLLATGHTNRQIAGQLGISPKTVGSHVEHIYAKAGVRTRAAATLYAVQNNLIG